MATRSRATSFTHVRNPYPTAMSQDDALRDYLETAVATRLKRTSEGLDQKKQNRSEGARVFKLQSRCVPAFSTGVRVYVCVCVSALALCRERSHTADATLRASYTAADSCGGGHGGTLGLASSVLQACPSQSAAIMAMPVTRRLCIRATTDVSGGGVGAEPFNKRGF